MLAPSFLNIESVLAFVEYGTARAYGSERWLLLCRQFGCVVCSCTAHLAASYGAFAPFGCKVWHGLCLRMLSMERLAPGMFDHVLRDRKVWHGLCLRMSLSIESVLAFVGGMRASQRCKVVGVRVLSKRGLPCLLHGEEAYLLRGESAMVVAKAYLLFESVLAFR